MRHRSSAVAFLLMSFIAAATSQVLPILPLLEAVGNVIPNTWSVSFRSGSPMDQIIRQIESTTSCTIAANHAEFYLLSITCPPLALPSLLALGTFLQYATYYEPELQWVSIQTQSNAPWGVDRTDQRNLPLTGTYNAGGFDGTGVDVHVLDTGVFGGHTDFGNRVRAGYDAIKDGRAPNTDCHGHGSHVAGTIGGTTSGIAKNVDIYASRVLGCFGPGSTTGIAAAIRWVVAQNTPRRKVINMSIGGGIAESLDAAVAEATAAGVVVVVAAGNDNKDACNGSPARAPSAITVMASDINDAKASFSNFGRCTDIIAPGVNIVSNSGSSANGRVTMSGTSMASPHVAGVVALILQAFPSYTVQQVTDHLLATSTPNKITGLDSASPNKLLFWASPSDRPSTTSSSSTSSTTSSTTSSSSSSRTPSSTRCAGLLNCLIGVPATGSAKRTQRI